MFIRGNHDSQATQRAVARQRNAVVLSGHVVTVDGLRIIGAGDPRFTPNLDVQVAGEASVVAMGQRLAAAARAAAPPPDIAVVHDPAAAPPLAGVVPLVLAGHIHRRVTWMLSKRHPAVHPGLDRRRGPARAAVQPAHPDRVLGALL